jgi:molybdopterin/thiamine biosynthesis adenylyltransferase
MDTEGISRVDVIVQHILKNKKLQLPKAYVRNPKAYQAQYADMEDELTVEASEVVEVVEVIEAIEAIDCATTDVFEPVAEVRTEKQAVEKKQRAKEKKDNEKDKEKKPSAYNIFVKDAVKKLQDSHKHLGSKERFQLAIQMWNDHKKKNTVTTTM